MSQLICACITYSLLSPAFHFFVLLNIYQSSFFSHVIASLAATGFSVSETYQVF